MTRSNFDHNATTPVAPEALEAMLPALGPGFGNASSIHHCDRRAKHSLETVREQVEALGVAAAATVERLRRVSPDCGAHA
ncbi:MAG: aminotransferase class V-fold PLP-dependent enzyme [Bryobacteraceae bacterium]